MRPKTVASSKRSGSSTVAVKRSPTRDSLLERVSLMRILRSVPTGTRGTTRLVVVVRLLVCALATGDVLTSATMARTTIEIRCIFLIVMLLKKTNEPGGWGSEGQCGTISFWDCTGHGLVFKHAPTVGGTVAVKDIRGRRFAHDDVLQTHQAVQERFGPRRTTWDVNVDRNTPIDTLHRGIRVEWSAGRSASAHCDGPFRLGHLVVHAPYDRAHLQSNCACDNDQVTLSRARTKDACAEAVDVETSRAGRDHLNGATGEAERHGPKRRLARPVDHRRREIHRLRTDAASNRVHYRIDGG